MSETEVEQISHSGEPLNWVGICFVIFWTFAGAIIALAMLEKVWLAIAIGCICEYVSARIAGYATKLIRTHLNDLEESCYGQ